MTNSEQAIREIAEKWGFSQDKTDEGFLIDNDRTKQCLSDLTALISDGYYPKEKYDELLRQRDELKEENEKLKRQIQSYNPYPNRPNPRDVNPYDIGSVKRARRGR